MRYARFFTPVVFVAAAPIVLAEVVAILVWVESRSGFIWGLNGWPEVAIGLLVPGSLTFLVAAVLAEQLEGVGELSAEKLTRQSAPLIIIAAGAFYVALRDGFRGGLGEGMVLVFGLISLWGVIVNFSYQVFRFKQGRPVS